MNVKNGVFATIIVVILFACVSVEPISKYHLKTHQNYYWKDISEVRIECGNTANDIANLVNIAGEKTMSYEIAGEKNLQITRQELIRFFQNSKNVVSVSRGSYNNKKFVILGYKDPYGEDLEGSDRGVDIVFSECSWDILDLTFWILDGSW